MIVCSQESMGIVGLAPAPGDRCARCQTRARLVRDAICAIILDNRNESSGKCRTGLTDGLAMRTLGLSLCFCVMLVRSAAAQDNPETQPAALAPYDEINELINSLQARVDRMNRAYPVITHTHNI